jgi:hypothetical protein
MEFGFGFVWRAAATPTLRAVNPETFGVWVYERA